MTFDIPIGGIEKYSKNSICINNGEDLTFMLAGKLIGTNDDDPLNTVLYYYKFDIDNNLLKYGAKLYHYNSDDTGDWFCLITTVNNNYKENNYESDTLSNEYEMEIYVFNANNFNVYDNVKGNLYNEAFRNIFCFKSYKDTNEIPFSIIRPEYESIKELLNYNGEYSSNTNEFTANSPIAIIENLLANSLHKSQIINLEYNTNNNEFVSIEDEKYDKILNFYKNEYQLNINEELSLLNEDIINLYYNIFNYYNEKYYLSTRSEFIKRILLKLYEEISQRDYSKSFKLYIPLNHQFHYICNSNDNMYIYYSNNTYVTFINLDNVNKTNFWNNNKSLIFDYNSDISKVKIYNFEVNYNSNNEKLINSVTVTDIFTMPYINGDNNWSINDNDTKIQATGKDAGNPNIIIVYSNDKNNTEESYQVLNAIANSEEINESKFKLKWFNVDKYLFENSSLLDIIKCCTYIPEVNVNNIEYFRNSIILSISDLECLEDETVKSLYKGAYIMTMWHLVEENNEYKFVCIGTSDSGSALALGSTVNPSTITGDLNETLLEEKDLLVLKAIITQLGQNNLNEYSRNWIVIKNKLSESYSHVDIGQYLNDLNMIVQYSDNLKSNNELTENNTKYISSMKDFKITNSLYPKYTITNSAFVGTKESIITNIQKINKSKITGIRTSVADIDGDEILTLDSLIQTLEDKYVENTDVVNEVINVKSLDVSTDNYNEYVFNTNIPTIDFGEVFNRNFNAINRVNIVSLDKDGKIYNAYIGTSYNEASKSVLHIGTTSTNINLGTESLIDEINKSEFNTHNALSLDFDEIILNAKNKISSKLTPVNEVTIDNIKYYTTTINILGKYDSSASNNKALFTNINHLNINTYAIKSKLNEHLLNLNLLLETYLGISINADRIKINIKSLDSLIESAESNNEQNTTVVVDDDMYYTLKFNNKMYIAFNNSIPNSFIGDTTMIKTIMKPLHIIYYETLDEQNNTLLNVFLSL